MSTFRNLLRTCAALAGSLLLSQTASAGLPLVCHPFSTGDAQVLPWVRAGGPWTSDPRYDIRKLTSDTLRLLSADAPTLARMENLRRATVYAMKDRDAANDLLKAVLARTQTQATSPRAAALAWFDAGYLVESYRQHGTTLRQDPLGDFDAANPGLRSALGVVDGNAFVQKAIAATHEPDMEYAASLMARDAASATKHRAAAKAGAKAGSLLAINLERN